MRCREVAAGLDAVLAGDVSLERLRSPSVDAHLARCARCGELWSSLGAITDARDGDDDPGLAGAVSRARDGLRAASGRLGHPAVSYDWLRTPIGRVFVGISDCGVWDVTFDAPDEAAYRRRLTTQVLELHRDPSRLEPALAELDAYFSGRLTRFSLEIDLRSVSGFTARVLAETRRIPFGAVLRYGDVAQRIGSPRASRAVGQALGRNPVPVVVPCHRVVAGGGRLGGFTGGVDTKRRLLAHEGHPLTDGLFRDRSGR